MSFQDIFGFDQIKCRKKQETLHVPKKKQWSHVHDVLFYIFVDHWTFEWINHLLKNKSKWKGIKSKVSTQSQDLLKNMYNEQFFTKQKRRKSSWTKKHPIKWSHTLKIILRSNFWSHRTKTKTDKKHIKEKNIYFHINVDVSVPQLAHGSERRFRIT